MGLLKSFSTEYRKTKSNVITTANQRRGDIFNILKSRWELKVKPTEFSEARENADDEVVIGFIFASDGREGGPNLFGPLTERSKAKPLQTLHWKLL